MKKILGVLFCFALSASADLPLQEQRMGYKESTPWEKKDGPGYDGYYKVAVKQDASVKPKTAEWSIDLPQTGRTYGVYATWVAEKGNSRNAPYSIFDGERPLGEVQVNQQQPPRGKKIKETGFQRLGVFPFTSRVIRIVLTSQSDGNVVSDSVLVLPE